MIESAPRTRPGGSLRSLRRALLVLPLLVTPGCFLFIPDTHDDMDRRLDGLRLPPGFQELYRERSGHRAGVTAGPDPSVSRTFAAPWKDRELCDELEALARSLGTLQPIASEINSPQLCSFQVQIGAGLDARLVGVWSYRLWISAQSRELVRRRTTDAKCRDELRRVQSTHRARYGVTGGRSLECWLPPGYAHVTFIVTGRQI